MDLQLEVKHLSERQAVIEAKGRLTAVTAPAMKAHIRELVDGGWTEILCDLRAVAFLDSSGLAALVSGLKSVREHDGWLKLVGLTPQVATIFRLTMLDRVFETYSTVEAALSEGVPAAGGA